MALPQAATEPHKVAIYARISSDQEALQLGVKRQEKDCQWLCESNGWHVAEVFVDNDKTAADPTKRRPEYERMVEAIRRGRIDAVVVAAVDRLQRQPAELEEFVKVCNEAGMGTLYVTPGLPFDLNDPQALYRLRDEVNRAALEVAMIRKRVKRQKLDLAERGEYHGGRRPFGFKPDGKTIDEDEAELLRDASHRLIHGATLRSIRTDWERQGIRTVQGLSHWSPSTFRNIMTNPRLAGLRVHQGEVIGDASWDAIIPRSEWEQLQVILKNPGRKTGNGVRKTYVLRGLLTCAECGHLLVGVPMGRPTKADPHRKIRYYRCHIDSGGCGKVAVMADHVERVVIDSVLELADHPEVRAELAAEDATTGARIKELVAANAEDKATIAQLEDDRAAGIMSREGLARNARRINERIETRNDELEALEGHTALAKYAGQLQEHWDDLYMDDRRTVIMSLLKSVAVKPVGGRRGFDPSRLVPEWRTTALAHLALALHEAGDFAAAAQAWFVAAAAREAQEPGYAERLAAEHEARLAKLREHIGEEAFKAMQDEAEALASGELTTPPAELAPRRKARSTGRTASTPQRQRPRSKRPTRRTV
jgi:DNA invertase Pin-like site-specific DNA recombinase